MAPDEAVILVTHAPLWLSAWCAYVPSEYCICRESRERSAQPRMLQLADVAAFISCQV